MDPIYARYRLRRKSSTLSVFFERALAATPPQGPCLIASITAQCCRRVDQNAEDYCTAVVSEFNEVGFGDQAAKLDQLTTTSQVQRHSGGSAGLQGGYDVEVGPVVVGVFGGYALLTSQSCGSLSGQNQGCLRPQAEAEGGARVGLQVRSRFLAYAKGSYVNTRINTTVRNGLSSYANSHINKDGWRVGGGVEFALLPHLYLKAEYDYTRTERFDAAPFGFQNTSISYHDHAASAGVGIRF